MTSDSTHPTNGARVVVADGLFDGEEVRGPSAVTIRGGLITSVVPVDGHGGQPDAVRTRYLLPGLIDAHVHITGYREGIPAGRPYEPQIHFLRLCVANGVTTLRDTGNSLEAIAYLKAWSERHEGPRIMAAGPLLDAPPFTWPFSRTVATEDDARREVDRLAYEGVDFIKVYRNVEPHVLGRTVEEAHKRGLRVAGDLQRTRVTDACRAGMDSVEHAITLLTSVAGDGAEGCGCASDSADALQRLASVDPDGAAADALSAAMLAEGSTLVPTLLVSRRWAFFDEMVSEPRNSLMAAVMPYHRHFESMRGAVGARIGRRIAGRYMPVRALSRAETRDALTGLDRLHAIVRRLGRDGVRLAAGTDTPNPSVVPGFSLHQELAELCRAGLDPVAALRAATAGAAELLGVEDVGVIRPGARADLVLLDADPTGDIAATQQISAVILRGRFVEREAMVKRVAEAAMATQ